MSIKFIKIFLISLCFTLSVSCDSISEKHKKTLEEKLIDSFEMSDEATQDKVQLIVSASKLNQYEQAMNELEILSSSQMNTPEQKNAIKLLMKQLRFNMDEIELSQMASPSK